MTSETAKTWPVGEGTEWFWAIVDRFGLGNVPSDEVSALRLLCDKAERYDALASTAGDGAGDWVTAERAYKDGYENGAGCYIGDGSPESMALAQGQSWDLYRAERLDNSPAVPASPRSGAGEGEGRDWRIVMRDLINEHDRNICLHEETHRGGTLWTICDTCGRKWADDGGGFVPYEEPPAVSAAWSLLRCEAVPAPEAPPPAHAEHGVEIRELLEEARSGLIAFTGGVDGSCGDTIARIDIALSQGGGAGRSERAVEIRELSEKADAALASQRYWSGEAVRAADALSEANQEIERLEHNLDVAKQERDAACNRAEAAEGALHRSEIAGRSEKGDGEDEGRRAIRFAMGLEDHWDRFEFLNAFIGGDLSEWPEFTKPEPAPAQSPSTSDAEG